jgi:hypothetical protein
MASTNDSPMWRTTSRPRCFLCGIQPELAHHLEDDLLVVSGLLEVLLPLFLEIGIDSTLKSRLINLDAALFSFQRLIQQFSHLFSLQLSPLWVRQWNPPNDSASLMP